MPVAELILRVNTTVKPAVARPEMVSACPCPSPSLG